MKTTVHIARCAAPRAAVMMLVLLCMSWVGGALADLRATFDRPTAYEGDTVTLTIESDGATPGGQPDLSALAADFDVQGTSTGSQISIINGRSSAKFSWRISLLPKTLGKIDVAPIRVGDEQTGPLSLTVSEVPQGAQGTPGDDVYLELQLGTDSDPVGDEVMVQQQVPVVVRLFSAVPIRGGDLSAPSADGAVLERLGEDTQYNTQRNGRDYQVIERRFSLSPQRSGELRIAPVQFEGELLGSGRTRAASADLGRLFNNPMMDRMIGDMSFPMLQRGEPVRARSRALTLQVKPRAEGFGGEHWLPAEAVAIDDSWAKQPPQLRVGEPATRTLKITAKGLAGAQIPEIVVPAPTGMRAYPEKTETESRTDGAKLFGVSAQRVTLIPTAGGSVEMPEIRVTWWDTVAQTERVTTVPAMTLDVEGPAAPANASTSAPASAPGTASVGPKPSAIEADGAAGTTPDQPIVDTQDKTHWLVGAGIGALALLGLGAALLWYRRRQRRIAERLRPNAQPAFSAEPQPRMGKLRDGLHQACAQNDADAAARALLAWAQAHWRRQPPANLAAVAGRLQGGAGPRGGASEQIQALERHLYAPDAGPWDGNALWLALKDGLGTTDGQVRSGADDLAPLYPHRARASR